MERFLALPLLAVALLGGCGESNDDSEPANDRATFEKEHPGSAIYGSPPLEFEADPGGDLAYTADEVTAKEGNVTIEFTNPQPTPHNVTVEAKGRGGGRVETETVSEDFAAITVTLDKRRDFIFYCSVPGHRKAGMEGKIVVE